MTTNQKAIDIIEKYDDQLSNLKNSEGWYKYTVAVKHLLEQDFVSNFEKEILKAYKLKDK